MNNPFIAVVNVYGEEVQRSEPILVHLLAVLEEQGVPNLVSLDLGVERVKNFCYVVGLS
jgi:hypothetical protein